MCSQERTEGTNSIRYLGSFLDGSDFLRKCLIYFLMKEKKSIGKVPPQRPPARNSHFFAWPCLTKVQQVLLQLERSSDIYCHCPCSVNFKEQDFLLFKIIQACKMTLNKVFYLDQIQLYALWTTCPSNHT